MKLIEHQNELHIKFKKIVDEFRSNVRHFLEENNLDEHTAHVTLIENRPNVPIYDVKYDIVDGKKTPTFFIKPDFAVLDDALIQLVLVNRGIN